MTKRRASLHRTPLLTAVEHVQPQHSATATANVHEFPALPESGFSVSLCLELLAETASLVSPHLSLREVADVRFADDFSSWSTHPVRCEARREGGALDVRLLQDRGGSEPRLVASARVYLAQARPAAATLAPGSDWVVDRRGHPANAEALYVSGSAPTHRLLQWALSTGLGQLGGGMGPRGPHFGTLPASVPLAASPGVLESLCQLAQWQWYALAGEPSQLEAIAKLEWFRLPRADEALIGHVRCRGSQGGAVCFDALAYGEDRKPTFQAHGLRLAPRTPKAGGPHPPRLEWQSFVRVLEGLGQTAAQ